MAFCCSIVHRHEINDFKCMLGFLYCVLDCADSDAIGGDMSLFAVHGDLIRAISQVFYVLYINGMRRMIGIVAGSTVVVEV